jgi:signal transduction histidine kinase
LEKEIKDIFKEEGGGSPKSLAVSSHRLVVLPINHELEVIGFLCLGPIDRQLEASFSIETIADMLRMIVLEMIRGRYQILLTSGLHGQVVRDSYEALKEKALSLEKSEKKYRALASGLELEVQKKAREVERTQIQLMQKDKLSSIGRLAAGVAHEINNPIGFIQSNLNTIKGYQKDLSGLLKRFEEILGLLNEKGSMDSTTEIRSAAMAVEEMKTEMDLAFILEDFEKSIQDSLDGTVRVSQIVADLKNFAHLDKAELEAMDINKGIESILNIVWNEIKYRAQLIREYGDVPLVECFPQRINQVFMHLLVNAAQAVDEQGEIRIRTWSDGEWVHVRISDTGHGIPKQDLNRIFDPFFTTKEVGKGTGLGLNVAYNIVRKHHGRIDVESEPGEGTAFTVRLPICAGNSKDYGEEA